jgi:hypothetical protein
MLEELNSTFALQLDPCPSTDKSGQVATDLHDQTDMLNVVFAGGSHSSRVIDHFQSESIKILDVTVPGFRLIDRYVESMEGDLSEILKDLPDDNTVVVYQIFDNSIFYGSREEGEKLVPQKGADRKYHVEGALRIVKKSEFRELFTKALDCLKLAKGKMIVLWVPLPRYLFDKCCTSPLHVINKGEEGYERAMRDILEEMASWMASMADMRRLKNVTIYNPMVPLGLLDDEADEEQILRLWGSDPVHPTDEAYEAIATHLRDTIESLVAEQKAKIDNIPDGNPQPLPPQRNPKPVRRESWIAGTEPVAKRQATPYNTTWNSGPARGNGGGRPWKRGFRGGGGRGGGGRGGGGRGGGNRGGRGGGGRGGRWMRGNN